MATLHFEVARADWAGGRTPFRTKRCTRFKKVIAAYESSEHVDLTGQLTVDGIQRAWDKHATVASLGIHEGSLVMVHAVEEDDEEDDEWVELQRGKRAVELRKRREQRRVL
ncbi:hypothetical protein TSOC_002708 [Tetrabaena socialis]|uniref:Ubiquitin-like domain-containing protein n=1 Tax=Tetrabaena socialis TaxID=47790 RepID=A0A2J8ADF2_9CHLO|nr:hypothetical protein TSOC_002708 [Tetrabaena socialis]|eukprot:PNH10551.1 hypothetical protein TSOC_002708 [Tetrabaena socialis]